MSRTVLVTDLLARVRRACDLENDSHVTDADIYAYLNNAYTEYWDLLIDAAPPDFRTKKVNFSTVAGTLEYALSTITSPDNDFYKLRSLALVTGDGRLQPLERFDDSQLDCFTPVREAKTMRLTYHPVCPVITSSPGSQTVEGYNGWEEFLVQAACLEIKTKRQEDASRFQSGKAEYAGRILKSANRDKMTPNRIIERKRRGFYFDSYTSEWADIRYCVRDGNIELVSVSDYWL